MGQQNVIKIAESYETDGTSIFFDLDTKTFFNYSGDTFSVEEMISIVCDNDFKMWHSDNFYKALKSL
jgi:hypothetical protein